MAILLFLFSCVRVWHAMGGVLMSVVVCHVHVGGHALTHVRKSYLYSSYYMARWVDMSARRRYGDVMIFGSRSYTAQTKYDPGKVEDHRPVQAFTYQIMFSCCVAARATVRYSSFGLHSSFLHMRLRAECLEHLLEPRSVFG